MVFSAAARLLIERLLAEASWPDTTCPNAAWVQAQARRLHALPVGLDLWSWWFLTPGGEAVLVEEGAAAEHRRHADRGRVLAALVWGSEKYPELRDAFPAREPDAVDCRCAAVQRGAAQAFLCPACGGLGWLPAAGGRAEPVA